MPVRVQLPLPVAWAMELASNRTRPFSGLPFSVKRTESVPSPPSRR
jgi:hypothetical protein